MTNFNAAPIEEQVKNLLEQNLAYSKQIYLISKKLKAYMLLGRIMSTISILFVVGPLILGLVYWQDIMGYVTSAVMPVGLGQEQGALNNLLPGGKINQQDLLKAINDQGGIFNAYKNILDLNNQQ
ncbi:MAG: hypothetical protein WCV73_01880 [Patescibacteria group bacterium]|jgi:hypothetical protein